MVLSLPFQPVCRPDCPGLDPVTGERLADLGEQPARQVLDPRWAALSAIELDDSTDGDTTAPKTTEGEERAETE